MRKRILSFILAVVLIFGVMPLRANAITEMAASADCIEFIKQIEGFHAVPYWDYSQWTVGFGTACSELFLEHYQKEGISIEEAEKQMTTHIALFNREVNKFMTRNQIQLTQQQFDAILSLCYNMGAAWLYKTDHQLVQAIVNGTTGNELVYLWGLHSNAGGKFHQGLLKRRMMEADLFLHGRYNTQMPADYASITYDSGNGKCEATAQGYDLHIPARPMAVPTYEGYRFLGWYTEAEGGVPVTELNADTNGMTLYAHWEKEGIADNIGGTPIEPTTVIVNAGMLNVRIGPGTSYSVAACVSQGTELLITATANRGNTLWGKCSQGWVSLAHTNYPTQTESEKEEETVILPMDATVMNASGVVVYNGPHTSYPQRGTLSQGQKIQILELREFFGQQWARFEGGWIRAERDIMFHDETILSHSFVATITNSYLNVRNGPGTSYSLAGTLSQNEQVEIFAVAEVQGTLWGRCYKGWISLTYTDFDKTMLPRYRNHTYSQWNTLEASSCTQQGTERRECLDCDHFEVRASDLLEHSFGQWCEVTAPTETQKGLERRDCQVCGYVETRELDPLQPEQPRVLVQSPVVRCSMSALALVLTKLGWAHCSRVTVWRSLSSPPSTARCGVAVKRVGSVSPAM